jgi:hypothetical protein
MIFSGLCFGQVLAMKINGCYCVWDNAVGGDNFLVRLSQKVNESSLQLERFKDILLTFINPRSSSTYTDDIFDQEIPADRTVQMSNIDISSRQKFEVNGNEGYNNHNTGIRNDDFVDFHGNRTGRHDHSSSTVEFATFNRTYPAVLLPPQKMSLDRGEEMMMETKHVTLDGDREETRNNISRNRKNL